MTRDSQDSPSNTDSKFLIIAGSLLLLIIILLGGLWLRMRARAMRAERDLAVLQIQQKAKGGFRFSGGPEALDAMLRQAAAKAMRRAVDREGLKTEQVKLDGRDVKAMRLPINAAERLGFKPGDIIIVEKSQTTTATAPVTTSATAPATP